MAYCDKCGNELQAGAQFCDKCGKPVNADPFAAQVEYRPLPDTGKSKLLAILLAGILGLFGIWGIGQIYLGNVGKGLLFFGAGVITGLLFIISLPLCSILFGLLGAAGYIIQLLDVIATPV
jgi:TM2 domain-containing membrane protein YozV